MDIIIEGQKLPNFELRLKENYTIDLNSLNNKNVILYFYPKDNTPGCTLEAKDFAANYKKFIALNTEIIGISKDDFNSHEDFSKQCGLPFSLASDQDESVCKLFGVWGERSMMGKKYMGIERSTFLIDKLRIVRKIWRNVSVNGHVDDVLKEIGRL